MKTHGKYRKNFIHGLGHGLGKNIHIKPYIKATSLDILKEGDIVTVEPGIYFKGKSGIRIEDDFLITKHGARQLTHAPSGLIMLPLPITTDVFEGCISMLNPCSSKIPEGL